ncbi:hypothetical protein EDD22DRAFT_1016752 [Suillus occidentalis]|nr:hypothetical protein EDD22DRAFT_1016752 [Suillus occidentalis]
MQTVKKKVILSTASDITGALQKVYFLREEDIEKPRTASTLPRLAELNDYVPIRNLGGNAGQKILVDLIRPFQNGVHFISAETRGLFGSVLNDFGPRFTCVDHAREQCLTGMIVSVEKDKEGLVTCLDESRHGLEDGNFVTFTEVQGMTDLNGCNPRKVIVKGPYTFAIGDTSDLGEYV